MRVLAILLLLFILTLLIAATHQPSTRTAGEDVRVETGVGDGPSPTATGRDGLRAHRSRPVAHIEPPSRLDRLDWRAR